MRSLCTVVALLAAAGAAWGDDELPRTLADGAREARLLELEARVRQLEGSQSDEEAIKKLQAAAAKEKQEEMHELPKRVSTIEKQMASAGQTWDASKMLNFSTADGNFTAKIGGRIYVVYKHIFERTDTGGGSGGANGPDQFILDTARIQLDGTFFKDFYYRLEWEQAKNAAGNANNDVFLGWQGLPWMKIQAGQFKVPYTQEETTSSRFIDFAERSILNRFAPSRDGGILFFGDLGEKVFEWAIGAFNGSGKNTADPNDESDVAIRLMVTPFKNTDMSFLKQLRLGVDLTYGDQDGGVPQADIHPGDITGSGITMFDFGGAAFLDGIRTRMTFNFSWLYGPFSLRAEYMQVEHELIDTALQSDITFTGWYVQATWLLTGETKPLENRVKPNNNFSPLNGGWGAFELAFRIANVDVSDAEDATLIAVGTNQETRQMTVGINWWWSPNMALRINYEMLSFDENIPGLASDPLGDDKLDVFYVRWQIDF